MIADRRELTSALICLERRSGASQEEPLLLGQSRPRAEPLLESIAKSGGRTTAPHRSITQSQRILVLPVLIFSITKKDSCSSQVNFSVEGRCDF